MLGWALKKGIQGATGAKDAPPEDGDTTQIEAPDTPAPVFAARAIKHAIFGTPAPPTEMMLGIKGDANRDKTDDALLKDSRSPMKPAGILLTPGTATARRKRVSFDHDVKAGTNGDPNPLSTKDNDTSARKKSLQQRLEESRSNKSKKTRIEVNGGGKQKGATAAEQSESGEDIFDDEWEDDICSQDVTIDLNEPHSRSGKYWKSEFNKYTGDARAEMEKLVKYKHLAKCYAQKKDAEAVELNQRLKEEHEKVKRMEEKLAEMTSQIATKRGRGSDTEDVALAKKLAEKTGSATQYKDRIKELESLLADQEDLIGKSRRTRIDASPRTEKTLLETSRELRRARTELKEMKRLREENERLKSNLLSAEQRTTKLGEENKRIAADSSQPPWVQKLEKQLRDAQDEAQRKDTELRNLKKEFNTLKQNAKSSRSQALQVLNEKNERIAELEKEVKALQEKSASNNRSKPLDVALAQHHRTSRNLQTDIASMSKPSIHERAKLGHPKRSMSAEDLTLDFTQDFTQHSLLDSPSQKLTAHRFSADLTDSMRDIEEQLRKERRERMEARRRDRDLVAENFDIPSLGTSMKAIAPNTSQPLSGHRRVMSDRINESSVKETRHRIPSSRATLGRSDRALVRGALDNLTNSRYTSNYRETRPPSPKFEAPGFDLLQNRFAKLGGPNPNDTVLTVNASRCSLPADRQAAARARLEQRRRERQKASDKENVRP